ncbi:MAG: CBS domain-containing protein [Phormidesmis sp. RL_2_1]|nr:CBS domain-containing protein [Phormidesmis sp. RL_2_1]
MTKVADIMTANVVTIRSAAKVIEAITSMQQREINALIVNKIYESDAYGIITASDIVSKVIAFGRDPSQLRVYEVMTKPCIVLNPNLGIEHAARLLSQHHLHSAPVIQGDLLGILSITDILQRSHKIAKPQSLVLADKIHHATETARQICHEAGPDSVECAQAWSVVDALQTELARQSAESLEKIASETFWNDYPEAFKDREYEEWCSG